MNLEPMHLILEKILPHSLFHTVYLHQNHLIVALLLKNLPLQYQIIHDALK